MSLLDVPLRQVDPSVIDADPFWATVVRGDDGAAYVILPLPRPEDPVPQGPEDAPDVVARLHAAWGAITPYVVAAGQRDDPVVAWRGPQAGRRLVVQTSLAGIGRAAGVDLLAVIGVRLGLAGWALRPQRLPDRALLAGRDDPDEPRVELTAAAGDGATVLCLETVSLHVDAAQAAEIAEATSWR